MVYLELENIVCISHTSIDLTNYDAISSRSFLFESIGIRKPTAKTVKLILPKGKVILKFRGGTKAAVIAKSRYE